MAKNIFSYTHFLIKIFCRKALNGLWFISYVRKKLDLEAVASSKIDSTLIATDNRAEFSKIKRK